VQKILMTNDLRLSAKEMVELCRDVDEDKKKWWRWQRLHGLCMAARQAAEQADLAQIAQRLETSTGLQRLRKLLKHALPKESKAAA